MEVVLSFVDTHTHTLRKVEVVSAGSDIKYKLSGGVIILLFHLLCSKMKDFSLSECLVGIKG